MTETPETVRDCIEEDAKVLTIEQAALDDLNDIGIAVLRREGNIGPKRFIIRVSEE